MRHERPSRPLGSHDRPASALGCRTVLAVFGAVVLLVGAILAWVVADSIPLMVFLTACFLAACLNVYWVIRRIRRER